jgi:hypothetical protein
MAVENFRLVSPVEKVERRDLPLNAPALATPSNANPLVQGEFMELDSTNPRTVIRSGGDILSWAIWAEKGRSDVQAIRKVPLLYMGTYEADTIVMTAAGLTHGGALMVDDVTFESLTRSGLVIHGGGAELVVGYVTRLPASNGNKLRFIQTMV